MCSVKKVIGIVCMALCLATTAMGQGSSVLAGGDWWRLTVRTTGLYRVTVADVPGLQGADVARIGLYGAGGDMLSLKNSETSTGDLRPLAIEVHDADGDGRFGSGDWLLFFGEGTDVWRYSTADRRWEMCRHAYASENYYFLTTTAAEPRRVALAPAVEADTVTDTYTAVAMVNNDRVNLFNTGQVWLGEKFSVTTTMRSFTLSLPAVARDIKLRYALANKSAATGASTCTLQATTVHIISPALASTPQCWRPSVARRRASHFRLHTTPARIPARDTLTISR